VVTTEDEEIAEIARRYGAEIIDRPIELAQDDTLIQPVMEHAVNSLEGYKPDIIALLNPTSPLRDSIDITMAIQHFTYGHYDSLLTVYPTGFVHLWELGDGQFTANYDYMHKTRRQEMPEHYRENGAVYLVKRELLMRSHHYIGGNLAVFSMDASHSIDIDSELDFIIAEALLNEG